MSDFTKRIEQAILATKETIKKEFDANVQNLSDYFNEVVARMLTDKEVIQELVIKQTINGVRAVQIGNKFNKSEGSWRTDGRPTNYWTFKDADLEKGISLALEKSDLLKKLQDGLEHTGFEIKIVAIMSAYYRLQLIW